MKLVWGAPNIYRLEVLWCGFKLVGALSAFIAGTCDLTSAKHTIYVLSISSNSLSLVELLRWTSYDRCIRGVEETRLPTFHLVTWHMESFCLRDGSQVSARRLACRPGQARKTRVIPETVPRTAIWQYSIDQGPGHSLKDSQSSGMCRSSQLC